MDFIADDAKLVIHNASFDMKFLNAELKRAGHKPLPWSRALDTLMLAREKFPGIARDAGCAVPPLRRGQFGRELHGALLDSELLAEVYLELIGGRQPDLVLDKPGAQDDAARSPDGQMRPRAARPRPLPPA